MRRAFEQNAREAAIEYAKLVLPHARELGLDVDPIKERMARWVTYLESYERDVAELEADDAIGQAEKHGLLITMRRARASVRKETFP